MSRGSGTTFLKRQKEAARQQKQRDKLERKKQRKLEKLNPGEDGQIMGLEDESGVFAAEEDGSSEDSPHGDVEDALPANEITAADRGK